MNLPFDLDLSGKTAVVTGAGGVLCSMFAKVLAQCGAKTAILDLNLEAAQKVADEITAEGYAAKAYKANVLDKEVMEEVHKAVLATSSSTAPAETIPVPPPPTSITSPATSTRTSPTSSTSIKTA